MAKDEEEFNEEPDEFTEEDDEGSHTEHKIKITAGNQEADVYTEEGVDELEESDEIEPWEEGFIKGAEEGGHCSHCHKPLGEIDEEDTIIEREVKGKLLRFCCEKCAEAGKK